MIVTRRNMAKMALAASGAAVAMPAIAQNQPTINWRMTSSFPKSLDTIYQGAPNIAKYVKEMTDSKFNIQVFAAGEIVPGLQALDATQNGTVECSHTYSGYYIGKEAALIFDGSLPFGMNPRQHHSWLLFGGGRALVDEVYDKFNVVSLQAGNTGAQMAGWLRKEMKTVDDFKGLKMRIAGFGGRVLQKLGGVPQQIAGGDIYPALEKGTLDAVEFVNVADDEKLGFYKVAPYAYGPFVMEMEASINLFVNKQAWNSLPPAYQSILRAACFQADTEMLASYDAKNPKALTSVVKAGAKINFFSNDILKALKIASEQVCDEEAAKNPLFKKLLDHWRGFRNDVQRYDNVADARAAIVAYSLLDVK